MKNYTYFLTAALLLCSFAYSEEESMPTKQIESQHHRFYAGADVFWIHQETSMTVGKFTKYEFYLTANAVLGGLRLGYDYLKPQAFYFGMNGLAAMGRSSLKIYDKDFFHPCNSKIEGTPLFTNIEQRYGYTFQSLISAKSTLIPFAGIGWYYFRSEFDISHSFSSWFYGAVGLRAAQKFYDSFDVGFNLKAMYAFAGTSRNFWGYEVALPLTWSLGTSKKWDLQFQPYLFQLNINTTEYFLGARLEAGYSF